MLEPLRFEKTADKPSLFTPNTVYFYPTAEEGRMNISVSSSDGLEDRTLLDKQDVIDLLAANSGSVVSIDGPTDQVVSTVAAFTITDYDSFKTYMLTAVSGSVSRINNIISYTAPATVQAAGFVINGRTINVNIVQPFVNQPVILTPIDNALNVLLSPVITSTAFSVSTGSDTHEGSDWQISTIFDFSTLFYQVVNSSTDKLSLADVHLNPSTNYYIRVRYKGASYGYSEWSASHVVATQTSPMPSTETAIITDPSAEVGVSFGSRVSLSGTGDRILISAEYTNVLTETDAGAAYVYKRTGNSWALEHTFTEPVPVGSNTFANNSVINESGNIVFIGCMNDSTSGQSFAGCVYVYRRVGTVWTFDTKLVSDIPEFNEWLGMSLCSANDGQTLFACGQHTVYVFTYQANSWILKTKIESPSGQINDYFGKWISCSQTGDQFIVSAVGTSNLAGVVYIFVYNGSTWVLEQTLTNDIVVADEYYGMSPCMDYTGTVVAVGISDKTVAGNAKAGEVKVYVKSGASWVLHSTLNDQSPAANSFFGSELALSKDGQRLAITSKNESINSLSDTGVLSLFTLVNGVWTFHSTLVASDAANTDGPFTDVAITSIGNVVAVGRGWGTAVSDNVVIFG